MDLKFHFPTELLGGEVGLPDPLAVNDNQKGLFLFSTTLIATWVAQVADMEAAGGLVTLDDLARYRTSWEQPVRLAQHFRCKKFVQKVRAELPNTDFSLLSAPPPGSGAILAGILGLVASLIFILCF